MRNIAVIMSYVGTAYHGWQLQKNDVTVAGTMEAALCKTLESETRIIGCGRTDAGVHARNYVAGFRTDSRIPLDRLPLALNSRLPVDIAVKRAVLVPESFNPIGSCIEKEYEYLIHNSRVRDPFLKDRVCFFPQPLDTERMSAAALYFVGEHDFRSVRSVGTETRTTVRTVSRCTVSVSGEIISVRIRANGFLYNMARAITGTLVYAGLGKLSPDEIPAILAAGDRTLAGPTMPPGGLYFDRIWYDESLGLG